MTIHAIVGAGQVGRRLAGHLAARGDQVLLISRRGTDVDGAVSVTADASDASGLIAATRRADIIYNCANPAYHRWPQDWPPIARALLASARGKTLVTLSNLYGYGPVTGPMTESTPLVGHTRKGTVRAQMWNEALAAHDAGELQAVEVRASDYIGEGGDQVMFGSRVVPRLRAGRSITMLGSLDQPHTWTYTEDVAVTLAAVALDPLTWGAAWHVPSNEPRTQREVLTDLADALEVSLPTVRTAGAMMLRLGGLFNASMRELTEMVYEFDRPFVMDSTRAQTQLGLKPTAWDQVIAATVAAC